MSGIWSEHCSIWTFTGNRSRKAVQDSSAGTPSRRNARARRKNWSQANSYDTTHRRNRWKAKS
nr:MAG TPA: formylglycinamide ribonucleotide amidotransferase [Caudoviricetes sp.]